jgi:hypothetical protein
MRDNETRVQMLLRLRNILVTKPGTLNHAETLWLVQIENELGIT